MRESHEAHRTVHATSRWTIARARRSLVGLALAVAGITACSGDAPTGPGSGSNSPVGSYTISTMNGKALPFTWFSDTNYKYEVTAGALSLTGDGKFSVVTTYRQTVVTNVETFVDSSSGTWKQSGANLSFVADDSTTNTATWANNQLTVSQVDGNVTTTVVYTLKK